MVHEGDIVTVFNSIHRVMKAERVLKLARLEILLIPVPRELSSDCGLAIRCARDAWPGVRARLEEENLLPSAIYRRLREGFEPVEG